MTDTATSPRQFSVHARHLDRHHARVLLEPSFEAAAIAYVEGLHASLDEPELSILVRDMAGGQEHCFRINLDTGETSACG